MARRRSEPDPRQREDAEKAGTAARRPVSFVHIAGGGRGPSFSAQVARIRSLGRQGQKATAMSLPFYLDAIRGSGHAIWQDAGDPAVFPHEELSRLTQADVP